MNGMLEGLAREVGRLSQEYVPRDTERLAESMVILKEGETWIVQYGVNMNDSSRSAPYAVYVHEIDRNYKVGGWKYLERAVQDTINSEYYKYEMSRQVQAHYNAIGNDMMGGGAFGWLQSPAHEQAGWAMTEVPMFQ